MPTPVGHALAGIAVAWLVDRPARRRRAFIQTTIAFALVATLPDIDLLFPTHRGPTHGLGSAAVVGAVAWLSTRRARTAAAFSLAYASHILLDWLGTDTTPPIGLMALWPLSRDYYQSASHVFMAVSRRYWLSEFWIYNLRVLVRELLILAPAVLLAWLVRYRRTGIPAVCAALLLGAPSAAAAQPSFEYIDAIEKYRAGEINAAIEAVFETKQSELTRQANELIKLAVTAEKRFPRFRAAIMLHTEAFLRRSGPWSINLADFHLDLARHLAQMYFKLGPDADFVRRWYLLVISHLQGIRDVGGDARALADLRELFPGNADVLLASGSHHEMLTLVSGGRVPLFNDKGEKTREERVDVEKELRRASEYFAAALVADPTVHEARLRLGRTLYRLGDAEGAARALDAVRTADTLDSYKVLAAIFLALVEEERGRRVRAGELYVEAMKLFPPGQTSFVGMSELLYADGQPGAAATVITRLLERPAPRDPWWAYIMGEWWHFDSRLAALRDLIRQ